ncbi:alpha-hydroxyacid dehydrogenase, FMN-dependent L-lactate dehydrogenase [Variovorax sp. CF313]|uniref:alpha-hydroxy acid oxidase n=1 Tax=Variovorax sp. CF313 TaxID=1144315 RepID=UPI000270EC28|nr:alpha-hydroxy acid oxidase [Variovorax sp. CF313]EJL72307.1 alpha-hydroxyacid dehydrogenase, FMN-dependent L-lactate dehydrogenase [Variovorax sp. CF313]
MNVNTAVNLEDLRLMAQRKLPRIAFDFIDGGVDDEECVRRNRAAFRRFQLVPRYLVDVSVRDQSTELLGRRYASPFGISPTGLAGLFHPGADELLAQAARQADVPFLLSSASNASVESVARLAPDHVWFQIYGTREERINTDLVKRARDAGVRTLVVSVDVPVNSNRERNRRNGFSRPFRMTPAVVFEALGHPAWVLRYLRTGGIPMMSNWAPYGRAGATASEVADLYGTLTPAPMIKWQTLEHIRAAWNGPLVVKGLLHPDDARQAAALGIDALIVSNHGGRQLDVAPTPIEMLPAIRAAVGERVELLVDSGVRRGSDIVIARCLGARFALFGRPTLFGAAAGGPQGIARAIQIVRNEIDMVMAQIGCSSFDALDARYLRTESAMPADASGQTT